MSPTLRPLARCCPVLLVLCVAAVARGQSDFVNWETPHVSPIALTPSGNTLLAVNTADNRLEVFDVSAGTPLHLRSIPVGLDPVSVRARTETEAWVINHVSDSLSIVDVSSGRVTRTVGTGDGPADVVFAGTNPQRAFVSVSALNQVRVWDTSNVTAAPTVLTIQGQRPKALAVSPDGLRVYAAIFQSGNATTMVRVQDVSSNGSPYGGLNPPPNSGNFFSPSLGVGLPPPPRVSMIVRRDGAGHWIDDNSHDWSSFVPWNMHDHDVALIDAASLAVTYANSLMTTVMAIGVRPDGTVTAIGTEAKNEVRWVENVQAIFVRSVMGSFSPATPATVQAADLNPHLSYTSRSVPQATRNLSTGDPRGIVWDNSTNGYVAGMGSNNVIVIGTAGQRLATIDVGTGPTGLALSNAHNRLYVLNKFSASISEIDTISRVELSRTAFFDPTPAAINLGRPLLYDTHQTSGLGQVSCGSCHIDGRSDFLGWDLGDPRGAMKTVNQPCRQGAGNCRPWHPMKGPMVTQSLQGIIGNEAFHWRGDKENLTAFNVAFTELQAADAAPSNADMQRMQDFISTIKYPPNNTRNPDGTLPTSVPTSGGGNGNANTGLTLFNTLPVLGGGATCLACHASPNVFAGAIDDPGPPGFPQALKIVQLRGMNEKLGFSVASQVNNTGFGFNHDSSADTLNALLNVAFNFGPPNLAPQRRRDVEAFMLALTNDTHAGVGQQVTLDGTNNASGGVTTFFNTFTPLADAGVIGIVAKGRQAGLDRGYTYRAGGSMQSDRLSETLSLTTLRSAAAAGSEVTFTVVPTVSLTRIGIDRDRDTFFDRDELDQCSNPDDAAITPARRGDLNHDGLVNNVDASTFAAILLGVTSPSAQQTCTADLNRDGHIDGGDIAPFVTCVLGGTCP